jgi:hypothetical protein
MVIHSFNPSYTGYTGSIGKRIAVQANPRAKMQDPIQKIKQEGWMCGSRGRAAA